MFVGVIVRQVIATAGKGGFHTGKLTVHRLLGLSKVTLANGRSM